MKTRAFDPIENRWRTDYVVTPDGEISMMTAGKDFFIDQSINLIRQPDWKLSRFTGLLDKNGKEIYEGDIVRHPEYYFYDHLMPGGIEVIEWEGNGFNELLWFGDGNYPAWVEVIGNIFENPEILEAEP